MARMVALSDIATEARYLSDQRPSGFTNDAEMLRLINSNYTELFDLLVAAFGDNYFSATEDISVTTGTQEYDLPDDFYKILGVDFSVNTGAYITLRPYDENERNRSLTTNSAIPTGTVRLRYVPAPEIFTSLDDEIDGVAGWERLLILAVAMDMMDAEESDTSALQRKFNRTYKRIEEMSKNRDQSMSGTVCDIYYSNMINTYGAMRYRLYGDQISFMSTEFLGADLYPPFV